MIVVNLDLHGELLILAVLDPLQHIGLLRHSIVHQIGQVVVSSDLAFTVLVRYIATLADNLSGRILRNQRARRCRSCDEINGRIVGCLCKYDTSILAGGSICFGIATLPDFDAMHHRLFHIAHAASRL